MAETHSKSKKSRKDRQRELRDDGIPRGVGIDYTAVRDRHVDDQRYERQKLREADTPPAAAEANARGPSLVMDAFVRLQAGLEGRTVAQKIADPNRPTWEQYKKENEDKLDMAGAELKKMVEYRRELDAERERRLKRLRSESKREVVSTDDEDNEEEDDSESKKKRKKKDKKHKKKKKHKKRRDRSRSRSRSQSSGSEIDYETTKRHKRSESHRSENEDSADAESSAL